MATARDGTNPYGDGLGVGGKFKKRPFRRSTQSTPYVRPPTAVRNPNGNGWLSKLVDPAQRLIASGAHKLFASVFRKRLPPPPPPPPIIERTDQERMESHQEATLTGSPGSRDGVIHQLDKPSSSADVSEFNELEQILKKKTFTRLEIDRLTILLHSRSADNPNAVEEKLPEVPIKVSQEKKEHYPNTMLKEVMDDQFISTPLVSQAVADEDVASPAELAKAYMGSRPSKVSSSIQNFGNQALVVGSRMPSNEILTSKSPKMSLVARHSGYAGGIRDSFATPRSRGRSAIYNMARTPYSRVQSVAKLKGGGLTSDGGPSSSSLNQNVLEQGRLSASKQGALKRTSSVLENDIGSFGPIRRIRHKSNLLSPKILSLSPPTSTLSIHKPGSMLDIRHPLSYVQNPASSREVKFTQTIGENDVMDIPGPSFTAVPSKSSETASKILKHLDMLVSTREKSPAKMSASMLSGQALRSLENVESPKYLESPVAKNKVDETRTSTVGVQDTTLNRRDGSPMKLLASINDSVPAAKSVNTGKPVEDGMLGVEVSGSSVNQTSANLHQGKKWAFHMSAHEDIVEVDDADRLNGVASTLELESREKLNVPDIERQNFASESLAIEKSAASEVKQLQNSEHKSDPGTPNGSEVVEKTAVPTFITNSSSVVDKASSKESYAAPTFNVVAKSVPKETNATVPASTSGSADIGKFSSGLFTSFASQSEKSVCATSIAVGDSDPPKVPESNKASKDQVENFVLPQNAVSSPASTSSSCGTVFSFSATSNNSSLMNGSLATSTFSFASHAVAPVSSVFTGKSSSDRSAPSVLSAAVSATAFSSPTTHSAITGGSSSSHAPAPSPTSAPVVNIASSVVASTSASTLTTNSSEQTAVRIKDSGFGNLMSASFGSSPASSTPVNLFNSGVSSVTSFAANSSSAATSAPATVGTDSSIFSGMSPSFPNIADSIPGGTSSAAGSASSNASSGATLGIASTVVPGTSTVGSTGSNIFGFSASAASSATTSSLLTTSATVSGISAQSMPIQFGSSASSPSFATSGNASSSGSALFSSSAPAGNLFSSGSSYVLSSSSGPSGISASSFSSGWEAPKSPFVSAFPSSASSGFTFGGSSAPVAVVSSAPLVFGSTTGASSSSPFSFASVAAVTSAPSLPFGGSSPSFTFGSSPSNNNDQMEDSMAEDTVQASALAAPLFGQQASQAALPVGSVFGQPNQAANPVAPIFGQQPNQAATPAASIFGQQPSSAGFVFGATPPSVTGNQNPFQFGSQQNTGMVQNSAPFQASGSIGAGGSFSLGSSGGDKSNRKIVRVNRNKLRKK